MENPLVSVVVISYNQAHYIVQMLDSLKAQTYTNWELIVADDKSQDDSVPVFKKWLSENNVAAQDIYHEVNTGVATVLNEAIELCKGKYVKLIAADDFMHPTCLEKSVRCLKEKGEEYGMVFTDTYCVDENGSIQKDFANYDELGQVSAEEFRTELIKGNRIAALTVLLKTEAIRKTGKYEERFIAEDYYRWLKINEKYLIAYLPEKLSYYRVHDTNVSKTKAGKIDMEVLEMQMMFDHKGIASRKINDYFYSRYFKGEKIDKELLYLYRKYPFANKRLKFCIQNSIPPVIYKIVSKVI